MQSKRLLLIVLLGLSVPVTVGLAVGDTAIQHGNVSEKTTMQDGNTIPQVALKIGSSGETTAPNEKEPSRSPEQKKSASEPDKSKAEDAQAAPLKDFVPSEKIAADNAVDFPADI